MLISVSVFAQLCIVNGKQKRKIDRSTVIQSSSSSLSPKYVIVKMGFFHYKNWKTLLSKYTAVSKIFLGLNTNQWFSFSFSLHACMHYKNGKPLKQDMNSKQIKLVCKENCVCWKSKYLCVFLCLGVIPKAQKQIKQRGRKKKTA